MIKAVPFLQGIQKLQGMSLDLHITQPAGNDSQQNGHHDRIDHGKLVKQGGISLSKGSGVRCAQAPCKPEEQDPQKSQRAEPDEASSQLLLFCTVLAGKISGFFHKLTCFPVRLKKISSRLICFSSRRSRPMPCSDSSRPACMTAESSAEVRYSF